MSESIKYTCSCCGKEHEEWPALTFISPTGYNVLSEEDKQNIAKIGSDFCIIQYPEQTDRFIRCVLTQKVIDHCENLEYGLWVSLSEKNFQDYWDNFENDNYVKQCFGWLANHLPEYDVHKGIPTTVVFRKGNDRPYIVPHDDFDHPFVRDYYNGITKEEAERRIRTMLKIPVGADKSIKSEKPWWKFW